MIFRFLLIDFLDIRTCSTNYIGKIRENISLQLKESIGCLREFSISDIRDYIRFSPQKLRSHSARDV